MTAITRSLAGLVCCSLAAGALTAAGVAALQPQTAAASSHREAPLISGQPQYDATDVYAFQSPDKSDTTTLVTNFLPFQDPAGGPNFYKFGTDARYDLHVDNDGDGQGDLLFRWTFEDHVKNGDTFLYNTGPVESLDDPDLNFTQSYDLEVIKLKNQRAVARAKLADDLPVAPSNVGKASMPDYKKLRDQAVQKIGYSGGSTSFAGQADDPFFADLRVFDLLYGGDMSEVGNDTLKGYNVQSLALQVPTKALTESDDQPVIGVWSTVHRRSAEGDWAQVSRLGNPLVNEVVLPRKDKDKFNASAPWDDGQFLKSVTEPELPKLIEQIYKIEAPDTPRDDLVQVFLTGVPKLNQPPHVRPSEMLRLNTSIKPAKDPKRLGVLDGDNAGFPNGRRPLDDVLDISLQAVEGELLGKKNDLGDAVDKNDQEFYGAFPFLALPSSGSDAKAVSKSAGSSLLEGGSGIGGSSEDTMVLAGSAASGGGAVLLVGLGLMWWRKSRRPARARRH
ncbi:DUF4331 domain-containing protein [Streptomyces botrytidirepellens]|uniref:DUF4331 domain-containing protein n=1 Tax=Streptomyces botrytidirepellens TaxID=2486417 RepID=A0A3M8WGB7_9ACTN|nr:DUF4331 domain-containing protein [Streptomyces botrytidirepellens]RNG27809.1 DUF4331 domain-containing protein [Streptomyces botrytidirepellens]